MQAAADCLKGSLTKISDATLTACVKFFTPGLSSKDHEELVARAFEEIVSQAIQELFVSLVEDPIDKQQLLGGVTEENFVETMKEDLQGAINQFSVANCVIMGKILDIADTSPSSISEQLFINGLDAFLSALSKKNKMDPLAREFKVDATAEDAIEQIIDFVFPFPENDSPAEVSLSGKQDKKRKAASENGTPLKVQVPENHVSSAEKIRSTRPLLEKGIAASDLQNLYWLEELREFCRQHGLKSNGKKSDLNRLVFNFLNNDATPTKKPKL